MRNNSVLTGVKEFFFDTLRYSAKAFVYILATVTLILMMVGIAILFSFFGLGWIAVLINIALGFGVFWALVERFVRWINS